MKRIRNHLFLRDCFMILLDLKENDIISNIARRTYITQSHSQIVIDEMVRHNLLSKVKQDRRRVLNLTKKGKKVQEIAKQLYFMSKGLVTENERLKNEIINR